MKLIDVSVPIDASLPTYPGNTPFSVEPRHSFDDAPGVDRLPLEMLIGRARVVDSCLPLRVVDADGAPARVLLRRN